jgi:hypothetical protein
MYLLIQNRGVAPEGAFTILGASGNRDAEGTIGLFGTGNKHAINCALREGLEVRVYCGIDRLEFGVADEQFEDQIVQRITLTKNGKKPVPRDWTLDWGSIDWTDIGMGLREFVSNAVDRSTRNGSLQEALDNGDLVVALTEKMQAKSGYTRVYVEASPDVLRYLSELDKRFLCFSSNDLTGMILPKFGRGLQGGGAMIYREGVFVRQICGMKSLRDYNFPADELSIDDCRNSSGYAVGGAVGKALREAKAEDLVPILESIGRNEQTFEGSLDSSYLNPSWSGPTVQQKKEWQDAWRTAFGDAVLTGGEAIVSDFVVQKGYVPKIIEADGWRSALAAFGIKTYRDVLSENERLGRVPVPSTAAAQKAVDQVWEWVEAAGMDFGKSKPPVHCFKNIMNAGSTVYGYYEEGAVYLNSTIADECNKMTLKVALEEVAHYVTGAKDNARDFQDFAFGFAVEFLA